MENLLDPTAVDYVYVSQRLRPDPSGRVLQDIPVGGFLRHLYIIQHDPRNHFAIYEMVIPPPFGQLTLPSDCEELFREQIVPDWRRIEIKAGQDFILDRQMPDRWNNEVMAKVILEVATLGVDLGYYPLHHRQGPDMVWEIQPDDVIGVVSIEDTRLVIKRRHYSRLARFQLEIGPNVQAAVRKVCSIYGLPPQFASWLAHVFYCGPVNVLARHFLRLTGFVTGGPFFSAALRLDPARWGLTIYQPGNWIEAQAADRLIPTVHDFAIKANIRLFRSQGFEALAPWLAHLRSLDDLPVPDARRSRSATLNTDWQWAMLVKDKVIQGPVNWVAMEVVEGLLESEGDFLLVGNLLHQGSRQLRKGGSDLRQSWEKIVGMNQYLVHANRPRQISQPHLELLRTLTALALGEEAEITVDKDQARERIREHLATFQRDHHRTQQEMADPRSVAIQRVLAQWRWSVKSVQTFRS